MDSTLILSLANHWPFKVAYTLTFTCLFFLDLYQLVLSMEKSKETFTCLFFLEPYLLILSIEKKQRDDCPTLINTQTHWREICQEWANQSTGVNGGKLMSDEPTPAPLGFNRVQNPCKTKHPQHQPILLS